MTLIYFIKDNGKGPYCIGEDTDPIYDPETCLIVPKRPNRAYFWNNTTKVWERTLESQANYIRGFRNPELTRTDKYALPDFPITAEQRTEAYAYRQLLRDAPDKPTIQEIVMPPCPEWMIE